MDKKEYLKNRFKRDFLQYSLLQEDSLPAKEIAEKLYGVIDLNWLNNQCQYEIKTLCNKYLSSEKVKVEGKLSNELSQELGYDLKDRIIAEYGQYLDGYSTEELSYIVISNIERNIELQTWGNGIVNMQEAIKLLVKKLNKISMHYGELYMVPISDYEVLEKFNKAKEVTSLESFQGNNIDYIIEYRSALMEYVRVSCENMLYAKLSKVYSSIADNIMELMMGCGSEDTKDDEIVTVVSNSKSLSPQKDHNIDVVVNDVEFTVENRKNVNSSQHFAPSQATYNPRIPIQEIAMETALGGMYTAAMSALPLFNFGRAIGRKLKNIGRPKAEYADVYSSIFAPAEVKRRSHLQVQVYLHLYEETERVISLAQESDKTAKRKDYMPLSLKLKKGDKVDVEFNVKGETRLMTERKSIVWQGSFTKCSFDYFVPKDIDVDELCCVALLSVNGVPIGEMRFKTSVNDTPKQLTTEIIAHKYSKVFISYSHQDESKVKFLHEGLELGSVPHFFDRKYLKAGDVFPQVIQDYISSADLFILCWSENASKSEYVQKERLQALERAFPQVQPENAAKLRIYPMNIEPRAELPSDMKNYYHFGEI